MTQTKWLLFAMVCMAIETQSCFSDSQVIFDQIGPSPAFLAGSASSSQFNPATPGSVFATVDNAPIPALGGPSQPVHITRLEAVVTGLQNFVDFSLVQS